METERNVILDLCGGSGSWSDPWREEFEVWVVDPRGGRFAGTVEEFERSPELTEIAPRVLGILAAPPCTEFASSGARWWKQKDPQLLESAIRTVRSCLAVIRRCDPVFWALENPIGRIRSSVPELGKPALVFDPCNYGDGYKKRTQLWGKFKLPRRNPVPIEHDHGFSPIHTMPESEERRIFRSVTPPGFARAFMEANKG